MEIGYMFLNLFDVIFSGAIDVQEKYVIPPTPTPYRYCNNSFIIVVAFIPSVKGRKVS